MKGSQIKTWSRCLLLSSLVFMLLLALVTTLTLRGALPEERLEGACMFSAALTAFAAAFLYRCTNKDAGVVSSVFCGGGFFLLGVLVSFLVGGELSWDRVLVSLAAVAAAALGANVLYAKGGFGKKKRGRRRTANR